MNKTPPLARRGEKMLTQTLRTLEGDGLVERTVYAVVPPRTEYRLTPLGLRFLEPIAALADWAKAHQTDLRPIFSRKRGETGKSGPRTAKWGQRASPVTDSISHA